MFMACTSAQMKGINFVACEKNNFHWFTIKVCKRDGTFQGIFDILKGGFPNQRIITSEASTQQNHPPSEAAPWKWQASRIFHWMEG